MLLLFSAAKFSSARVEKHWKTNLCIVNKGTPVPYRATNPGTASLFCSCEPGYCSHLCTESSSQRCSWTPESYTGNCKTHSCRAKRQHAASSRGILPPTAGGIFCFQDVIGVRGVIKPGNWQERTKSQPDTELVLGKPRALAQQQEKMHRALLGASLREEKLIAEKAEKKQCAEREDHSRCRYFPVSRHIISTFQASPSSVY